MSPADTKHGFAGAPRSSPPGAAPGLDFLSPEYNRVDPLQDCTGNFRSFETLEGIVTADMRHQAERARAGVAVPTEEAGAAASSRGAARVEAPASDTAEPLIVTSRGRVLIVAEDAGRALACVRRLVGQGLTCTLIVTGDEGSGGGPSPAARGLLREARGVAITGAFGGFLATETPRTDDEGPPGRAAGEPEHFDCVLDLQQTPSYAGRLLPLGYYAAGSDSERLEAALAELPEMRGRFEKPRFTTLVEGRCLRGRPRAGDCRRCAEACPVGAIREEQRRVAVDHATCQGCGACSLVCPSGAMRMAHPFAAEQLDRLGRVLCDRQAGAGEPLTLTIREAGPGGGAAGTEEGRGRPEGRQVTLVVDHIGHVRLETLLFALAHGADAVVVACAAAAPPPVSEAVRWQTTLAAAILRGCSLPAERVRFVLCEADEDAPSAPALAAVSAEDGPAGGARRPQCSSPDDTQSLVRASAQLLYERSGACEPSLPLPAGACFGTVGLTAARCTLCMACVAACPTGALSARGDAPRLEFRESLCRQCGVCAKTCPEGALTPQPRLLCDPEAVDAPAVLHEVEAARCLACGAAFASKAMVGRMRDRLRGHWMYADERQLRRLELCGACRARDTLGSEDVRRWRQ